MLYRSCPGKYQKKHWQEGSLFFDEEAFGFIEPIFERCIGGYNHYSMNDGSKEEWEKIIVELEQLNEILKSSTGFEFLLDKMGFIFNGTRDRFQTNFLESKKLLLRMNEELVAWAKETLKSHNHIAVLGI